MINRRFFLEYVKENLFGGSLAAPQTAGLNAILDEWEQHHAAKDDRWLAYALGTTHHEVAKTMRPIHEKGGNNYFFKMYDKDGNRPAVAARLGNTKAGDGVLFHGRGYVQLTGRANYKKMGTVFSVDLTTNAAAANQVLQPDLAAKIMFYGMEKGSFTGKKFGDYFKGPTEQWKQARRIINGLDQADKIAGHAKHYYAAISYTR